ncbi:LOW QUALITY PROTEIN: glutamate-rich protein 3 [Morus bassanus]
MSETVVHPVTSCRIFKFGVGVLSNAWSCRRAERVLRPLLPAGLGPRQAGGCRCAPGEPRRGSRAGAAPQPAPPSCGRAGSARPGPPRQRPAGAGARRRGGWRGRGAAPGGGPPVPPGGRGTRHWRRGAPPAPRPPRRVLATPRDAAGGAGARAAPGPSWQPRGAAARPAGAMSGPQPGFLATYNSLTDKHLIGYFSNTRIRRHLQRSGLISRSGRIISEKEYQLNAMRRDHQRYVQECLAQAIFHKVLDMERHHQLEIKKKLENSVRKERVQKTKVEQSRRSVEGASPMRCPHPPLGPRNRYGLRPLVAGEPAGHLQLRVPRPVVDYNGGHPSHQHQSKEPAFSKMTSWRPNTAPGNMQQPLRLQPLRSCTAVGSVPKTSSSKQKCHALENDQQFASGGERSGLRLMSSVEYVTGISPYQLPVIHNYMIPVPPPALQKGEKSVSAVRNGMLRGRRFHPITAPNGLEQLSTKNSGGFPKPSLRSNAFVTMVFLGKSVHLSHDDVDYRDEIKVYQQHCGGENLCVYKGKLLEGETFQFISKRHHGFPFSLTFFLNGMQVDRLSCCCEYKHQKRSRLGGRHGYFGLLNVEGASPCYRCIIAMGLDKKPPPPKRKMEDHEEKPVGSWRVGVRSEPSRSSVEQKSSKDSLLVILPGHEVNVETIEDKMESGQEYRKEERKKLPDRESEDSQEDTSKNEYDEDFEAGEEVNEEGQTGDQMNGVSKSSSDDKKHNLDYEEESKNSSQKALQASDSEKNESDGYSGSDSEDDKQGRRPAQSVSSISTQYSSEDDSHAETMKDNIKGKEEYNIRRASDNTEHAQYGNENGENKLLRMEENQETFALEKEGIDEAEKAKPEDLTAREDTAIFHENITAIQHQIPEVNGELRQAGSVESNIGEDGEKNASTRRDDGEESLLVPLERNMTEVEDSNEESPQSDEGGVFEDCKPVQEEIAKAIGNDHHVNSEPEASGSCADEEEENVTSTEHDANEAPDGAFLAEGTRTLDVQKAAEQVLREGQMVGERQALEKEDFVAEGGDTRTKEAGEEMARAGDLLPKEDTLAVLQVEGQLAVEESAPEESTMAKQDLKGKGSEKGMESGAEVAPGEQEVLTEGTESEAALGEQAPGGEELAGAGALLGREADGAVSEREEVAGEVSEGEEAVEEASEAEEAVGVVGPPVKEAVGETVSEAEAAVEEGGFAGKGVVAGAVSEGEEAVEDASLAEEEVARVVGPEGEGSVEEAISEGQEVVEKLGALLETLGDTNICMGKAMPGGEDFVKPNEFSQLKASGEKWMEMGKATIGAATSDTGKASEVEESSLLRAEDAVEESVEPGKGPMLQVAPGLEALVDAGGDPVTEGSSQLEETATAEEEEGSAEALSSGNPSLGSEAKTEGAAEEQPDGGVMVVPAEIAIAESGAGEEVTAGAAGPRELAAGMEGSLECAKERGKERPPGEGRVDEAVLPAPGLCVSGAGEAGVVAAVVGGQTGRGAQAEGAAGEPALAGEAAGQEVAVAGDGGVGGGAVAQEGVTGAVWGGQSVTGVAVAEGVSAEGRGAAGESVRDREGVADGAMACEQGVSQEAALGCEGRGPAPARAEGQGEVEWEWGTARLLSPQHGEPCGPMSLGEQPIAETSPRTPALGDGGAEPKGRGSTGGEGLCCDAQPQLAAPETGAAAGKDGLQEGTEQQVGVKAEGEQPGLRENMRERERAGVSESAQSASGVREQRKDSPIGGSPDTPEAADAGERSAGPHEDVINPDAVVVPFVQPQDGEETLL